MTAIYSIPETISRKFGFRSKPVVPRNINAIVLTYQYWADLPVTLTSLLALKTPPNQISVVIDNTKSEVPTWLVHGGFV
jgi:hypothetical protein